ncbi:MAG: glycoside hydrolase family 2 protein [Thermoguttaceae bacterium]
MNFLVKKLLTLTVVLVSVCVTVFAADDPLRDYPRPTLVREKWLSLNGAWQLAVLPSRPVADGPSAEQLRAAIRRAAFAQRIQVPFPIESPLSGVKAAADHFAYRRTFTIPSDWDADKRIVLNFGGVDWETQVWVNEKFVGQHRGGYDPFSFDITDALNSRGETNTIEIVVFDPTEKGGQPRGRQSRSAGETFYTPSSGIWQTVWLEPVPASSIRRVSYRTDIAAKTITFVVEATQLLAGETIEVEIHRDGNVIGRGAGGSGGPIVLALDAEVKAWSPESPHLDAVVVSIVDGDRCVDRISSYVAFRTLALAQDSQKNYRLTLNGTPIFLRGVVDQGMWQGGLYTSPSDEAICRDILTAKSLGFNLIRKYDKIEPERWYYWCDRIGMAVWQDMPSGRNETPDDQQQFRRELQTLLTSRDFHPSILVWSIFCEGRGQFQTDSLTQLVQQTDPTRFVCSASGWNDVGTGDITATHRLPYPLAPERTNGRASVVAIYGGVTLGVNGHTWEPAATTGFYTAPDADAFLQQYKTMQQTIEQMRTQTGIDAAIFYQLTDVEADGSGLQTYDREVLKVPRP